MPDLLQCQLQPYLRTCQATVIKCTPTPTAGSASKKKSRDATAAATAATYDVEVDDTVLYPEGGGQPSDYGTINDTIAVLHSEKTVNNRVIHRVAAPVTEQSAVTITVDWARRFDHMQQHSAQHLLSAVFIQTRSAETGSWWLSSHPDQCYIDLNVSEVTGEQLAAAEAQCNEIIRENRAMNVLTFPSVSDALSNADLVSKLPTHKKTSLSDNDSALKGTVRLIEIAGVDLNPCGGTHLSSTGQIQSIILTKTEKIKAGTRMYFLAGGRAATQCKDALALIRGVNALLSTQSDTVIEQLQRLQSEQRSLAKQSTRMTKELAVLIAKQLMGEWTDSGSGGRLVSYHRDDSTMLFLSAIADQFKELLAASLSPSPLLFLTCSDSVDSKDGQFLIVGGKDVNEVAAIGTEAAMLMEGRGGGKGRYQGKAARVDKRSEVLTAIRARLESP